MSVGLALHDGALVVTDGRRGRYTDAVLVTSVSDLVAVVDLAQVSTCTSGVVRSPVAIAAISFEQTIEETPEVEVNRDTDLEVDIEQAIEQASGVHLVVTSDLGRRGGSGQCQRGSDEGEESEEFRSEHGVSSRERLGG